MSTAASLQVRIGSRVLVKDRNVRGTIRFSGNTHFSTGKWIGVELDEAVGKNNGSVSGRIYFLCDEDHGIFVRQNQIDILSGNDTWSPSIKEEAVSPPKELEIPLVKSPPLLSAVTPMKERSRSLLIAPKGTTVGKTVSPVSSPRPKRRVTTKTTAAGAKLAETGKYTIVQSGPFGNPGPNVWLVKLILNNQLIMNNSKFPGIFNDPDYNN